MGGGLVVSSQHHLPFTNVHWPHCVLEASPLPLPVSARTGSVCVLGAEGGARGEVGGNKFAFHSPSPCQQWLLALLCCLRLPSTSTRVCSDGKEQRGGVPLPGRTASAPLWSCGRRPAASVATIPALPLPTSLLTPGGPPSDA